MESVEVKGYNDAFTTLTHRDLAQSLYDESAIIMQEVILTIDGNDHVKRRKTEFHLFRKEISRNYEQVDFPKILDPILDEAVSKGSSNLVELGYLITMNVTADIAGIDRPKKTDSETKKLLELVKIFSEGATLVHSLKDKEKIRQQVLVALESFDGDFYQRSLERRQILLERFERGKIIETELPKDILMLLLRHQKILKLSDEIIRREVAFYLQAGSHSTANASIHAFHELSEWIRMHPEDETSIRNDMFFMQKCVFETMRLHPASPVAWRKALCHVNLPDEQKVEKGDRVVIDLWGANRDPSIYGEDARDYNPYRKIPEKYPPWGLSFGVGAHACLGRILDGGEIPGPESDPKEHNFGLISYFMKGLLNRGAQPSTENPPKQDSNTKRPNWGSYPIIFRN